MNTFYFFGQEDDDSDEYYAIYEMSNLAMMRIISTILFTYTEFEATKDVDCTVVCVPNYLHSEMIQRAMSKHKICEKPACIDPKDLAAATTTAHT